MTRLTQFPILMCVVAASLCGCGFRPMYGDYTAPSAQTSPSAHFSQMAIDIIPDREGQILRNHLMDRFYKNGTPSNPNATLHIEKLNEVRHELDLTKSSEATRAQLRINTKMKLTDAATGQILLERDLQTITSFNILGSEFATRVTEDSARQSAINDIARQVELNLSLFYNDQK